MSTTVPRGTAAIRSSVAAPLDQPPRAGGEEQGVAVVDGPEELVQAEGVAQRLPALAVGGRGGGCRRASQAGRVGAPARQGGLLVEIDAVPGEGGVELADHFHTPHAPASSPRISSARTSIGSEPVSESRKWPW